MTFFRLFLVCMVSLMVLGCGGDSFCAVKYMGVNCDVCAVNFKLVYFVCVLCQFFFTGVNCGKCEIGWAGDNCEGCVDHFIGEFCD